MFARGNGDVDFYFYKKYFDAGNNFYGYKKIRGTQPAEGYKWKKLNIDIASFEEQIVIKPQYQDALEFSEGLAAVFFNNRWGVINEKNEVVIPPEYDWIGEDANTGEEFAFREGLSPIKMQEHWGYVDGTGVVLIPAIYTAAKCIRCGVAWVKFPGDNHWSLITNKGNLIKHTKFQLVTPFFEDLAAALDDSEGWCYVGTNGEIIINRKTLNPFKRSGFESASAFSDGMAVVQTSNKFYGYVNKKGRLCIKEIFIEALGFSHGLAGAKQDSLWGFINKAGEWVIEPKFVSINSFMQNQDGSITAKVCDGDSTYFINR